MTVADTLLNLDFGVSTYSVRGITQTLTPDGNASRMRRTVNGRLDDLGDTNFRKYVSTISCRDTDSPALSGVWPGMAVVVDCIVELCYLTASGSAQRTVVSGSSRVSGLFTFYRPQLTMRVSNYSIDKDEWGAVVGWTLELIEV
jgi:hypothetical protein